MKRIVVALALFHLASCDTLDLVPISQRSVEGFYQNQTQLNQAIMGCYNGLRNALVSQQYSYMLTESRSDNTFQSLDYNDGNITRFSETSLLPVLYTAWSNSYNKIQRCNKVLEELPKIDIESQLAKQYEGEAKFIRALLYFDMIRFWGGVPIVTKSLTINEGYEVSRNSIEEVYSLIEQDLRDAAELLPSAYDAANYGRATRWAAKGFLGKTLVYQSGYPLQKNRWTEAANILKEVIDSGQFEFFEDYAEIFKHANERGKQSVFSLIFRSGAEGEGNPFPTRNAPNFVSRNEVPFGGSPLQLFLSADLINSFEAGDLRKDAAIASTWTHTSGEVIESMPYSKKYLDGPVAAASDWDINWIALRYDDVLMLYAECLNENGFNPDGEAVTILNRFRTRAGLEPKSVNSQQEFRLWMENERRFEFCFENQRWFDLVRTDRALEVMKSFLAQYGLESAMQSKDRYFYPIPQPAIDINNKITQNPGYD